MSNNSTSLRQTFGTMVGEVTFGRNSRTQSVARIRARVVGAVSPVNRTLIHESGTYDDQLDLMAARCD